MRLKIVYFIIDFRPCWLRVFFILAISLSELNKLERLKILALKVEDLDSLVKLDSLEEISIEKD
jgi:hypothetical protein